MQLPAGLLCSLAGTATAVWDFDGVIADTEPAQLSAFETVLKQQGITPEPGFFRHYMGRAERDIWSDLQQRYQLVDDVEILCERRAKIYLEHAKQRVKPAAHTTELIKYVANCGSQNVIVSSGNYAHIVALLESWGMANSFAAIFSSESPRSEVLLTKYARLEHVARSFPHPMMLFEDGAPYLRWACERDITTVGIQHSLNDLTHSSADYFLAMPS
jgi:phosphoglycolate phosphatase-like HAD superfamily hydrolase